MQLDEAFKKVAVIGAAGKMGNGISALLNQEMARIEAEKKGLTGSGHYSLTLIDPNEEALFSLKKYLRQQLIRFAEKNIGRLRKYYSSNPKLISNEEIIDDFIQGSQDTIRFETDLQKAKDSTLIFEAISENIPLKVETMKAIRNHKNQYFFSNTSSIPISLLNRLAQLDNRIIGFHFYNPPIVQKLVELIIPTATQSDLKEMASELVNRLGKVSVNSHDISGFIGNGHFLPEVIFACKLARDLKNRYSFSWEKSIYILNEITKHYLIRPMGIFQLMDFVGIDICNNIATIMREHVPLPELKDEWLEKMCSVGAVGGQYPNGVQKDGCFQYDNTAIKGIYNLEKKRFDSISDLQLECKQLLESIEAPSWKNLQNDPEKDKKISLYFNHLNKTKTFAGEIALTFFKKSQEIALGLVKRHVADSIQDVNTVLKNGFFHLYGIIEDIHEPI